MGQHGSPERQLHSFSSVFLAALVADLERCEERGLPAEAAVRLSECFCEAARMLRESGGCVAQIGRRVDQLRGIFDAWDDAEAPTHRVRYRLNLRGRRKRLTRAISRKFPELVGTIQSDLPGRVLEVFGPLVTSHADVFPNAAKEYNRLRRAR